MLTEISTPPLHEKLPCEGFLKVSKLEPELLKFIEFYVKISKI